MKVAFLTRYAYRGASSRVRAIQFASALAEQGIEASFWPLLSDRYLAARYAGRGALGKVLACYWTRLGQLGAMQSVDLLWIEKELLPFAPYGLESWLLRKRRYVIDFDDAIFHNYDLAGSSIVRQLLGRKIDRLMAGAILVTAGNAYLAERAVAAGSRRVERMPSVVELDRYRVPQGATPENRPSDAPLRVVWIGSPSTVRYLDLVRVPFEKVARERLLELHVIGAAAPRWAGVAASSVRIMPLRDSPWERGKCGYKLIQYMACGLPVIASPVGMNSEIVAAGIDGLLASTVEQWTDSLLQLAADPALRRLMGARGRAKVEAQYCVEAVAPRLAALLKEAAG
jgi:glycosyltransferase involved in cell wall biosynthesis